jgi:hypothetical protein
LRLRRRAGSSGNAGLRSGSQTRPALRDWTAAAAAAARRRRQQPIRVLTTRCADHCVIGRPVALRIRVKLPKHSKFPLAPAAPPCTGVHSLLHILTWNHITRGLAESERNRIWRPATDPFEKLRWPRSEMLPVSANTTNVDDQNIKRRNALIRHRSLSPDASGKKKTASNASKNGMRAWKSLPKLEISRKEYNRQVGIALMEDHVKPEQDRSSESISVFDELMRAVRSEWANCKLQTTKSDCPT